jgi:hypothetical protein
MLSLSPTLNLPAPDADGNRVGGSFGVADMVARVASGETLVVSGFGRLLEQRDTRINEARNSSARRSTDVKKKRSELLILLTPKIIHSAAN